METLKKNSELMVINLFAGPGTGKSTLMAGLFYELKRRGIACEMTPEYAKDKVYGENWLDMSNQIYLGAKQYHKLYRLVGKVEIAISDSPLPFSIYYDQTKNMHFRALIMDLFRSFNNLNFFIERDLGIPYEEGGRLQTLEESIAIDKEIKTILHDSGIPFVSVPVHDALHVILDAVAVERSKRRKKEERKEETEDE